MPELVCDTSVVQYLHQLQLLGELPALAERVCVPPAVVEELAEGVTLGENLPNPEALPWLRIQQPRTTEAVPTTGDLGPGEVEVLSLAKERPEAVAVLDDRRARQAAEALGLRLTGTLGLLLDLKSAGHVAAVAPLLDRLEMLGFHLADRTRQAVLRQAGEAERASE